MKHIKEFNEFINEKTIGTIDEVVKIKVILDTSKHAEQRKTRHGEDNPIKDEDIIKSVEKAFDTIATNQLKGIDKIGRKYWIYDKAKHDLNVIGSLQRNKDELHFFVITVMFEKDFNGSNDAKKIIV